MFLGFLWSRILWKMEIIATHHSTGISLWIQRSSWQGHSQEQKIPRGKIGRIPKLSERVHMAPVFTWGDSIISLFVIPAFVVYLNIKCHVSSWQAWAMLFVHSLGNATIWRLLVSCLFQRLSIFLILKAFYTSSTAWNIKKNIPVRRSRSSAFEYFLMTQLLHN